MQDGTAEARPSLGRNQRLVRNLDLVRHVVRNLDRLLERVLDRLCDERLAFLSDVDLTHLFLCRSRSQARQ